ncbi:STAS domain-containing protein [Actinoplanes sp. G11-F43]|uniref:STAS domain-containing protein n=1 Tax=Actinoplanes sp. G11-F43 TaxID=3424130 RepID=UPI003D357390
MGGCPEDLIVTTVRAGPGDTLVRVIGELDVRTTPVLSLALWAAVGERPGAPVRLDLAGVSFCDVAALRALHLLGPERLRIVAAHRAVDTVLRLCGIGTFLGHTAGAPAVRPTPTVNVRRRPGGP